MGSRRLASKELASAEMELQVPLLTIFLLLTSVLAVPFPFKSGSGKTCNLVRSPTKTSAECFSEPECEDKCSTTYEQQCSTKQEQQCSTVQEQKCSTRQEQQCNTVNEQKCSTVNEQKCNTVQDNQCSTIQERKCSTVNKQQCSTVA